MQGESAFENMAHFNFYGVWFLTDGYPVLSRPDMEPIAPPPIIVRLSSPPNEWEFPTPGKDTLRWEKSEWIEEYHFQISMQEDFSDLIVDSTVSDTSYIFDSVAAVGFEAFSAATYFWRVKALYQIDEGEWSEVWRFTAAESVSTEYENGVPDTYRLYANYPNPFNPETRIRYELPERVQVSLEVYNVLGQHVATLVNNTQSAGRYEVTFDSRGLSSGVYLYHLKTESHIETKQMLLMK